MQVRSKRFMVLVIVLGVFTTFFIAFLIPVVLGDIFEGNHIINIIFIGSPILFSAAFVLALAYFIYKESTLRVLQLDNLNVLGKKTDFNNLYSLQRKVFSIARFRKKQAQHIIAFTFSNIVVAQNVNRTEEIFGLNSFIVDFLNDLPKTLGVSQGDFIFAFNRGVFFIYTFKQNDQSLTGICDILTKAIYDYADKNCRYVSVQPFFGIEKVGDQETLLEYLENAQIAREYSERNFESVTFYQPDFRKTVNSNDVDELHEALEKKEFVVYYQPKYDLANKRFISSEALIRWNSEKYGLLSPGKFLGKAEAVGLTHEIDTFVLRKVCEDLNDSIRRGRRVLPVSVNFSLYEFYSASFLDMIVAIMDEYKIPSHLIEIEITEATSQANQFLSISIIKKLKEKGIRVLMDDFGIGFSNVGNLKKIPFDAVKIDKTFIDDIETDPKAREIVKFLIGLCKVNGMEVIAEGVDNKAQVDILTRNKCDTIQGYYYSKPISKADYDKFLLGNPFEKKEVAKQ